VFEIQTAGDFDVDVYHAGELHKPRAQEAMAKFVMISGTTCHRANREQGLHHTGAIRGMRRLWQLSVKMQDAAHLPRPKGFRDGAGPVAWPSCKRENVDEETARL